MVQSSTRIQYVLWRLCHPRRLKVYKETKYRKLKIFSLFMSRKYETISGNEIISGQNLVFGWAVTKLIRNVRLAVGWTSNTVIKEIHAMFQCI